jgi:two-component system sensor histidine kinase UhpB
VRPWRQAWWLLPLALLLLFAWIGTLTHPTWREVRTLVVGDWQATRCVSESREWQAIDLPFSRRGDCWLLRTRLERTGLDLEGAVLMLGGAHEDLSVVVNGTQVRTADPSGSHSQASTAMWLPVASGLLRPGANELLLELRSAPGARAQVYLSVALVGPRPLMGPFEQRYRWLHDGGAGAVLVLLSGMLLFLVPIAIARPREPLYRWFALALVGSVVYVSNFAMSWRPAGLAAWSVFIHLGQVLAAYALARCSFALVDEPPPRWAARLALAAIAAILLFWLLRSFDWALILTLAVAHRVLALMLVTGLGIWWWRRRARVQLPSGHWFAAAMALVAILGVHDTLRVYLRGIWSTPGYLLHWGILYASLLLFVVLLLRILDGLRQAESGRAELAQALAQRTRELETEFGRRRAAEAAQTLAEERARIMRDMHDGVGGQLVALIGQVQAGQVEPAHLEPQLRRTLDDLRLMIDSLDSACADLSVALGMLRARMEPLLSSQAVRVVWRTAHLPDLPPVPPATVLNVLRILQEALTNALKHAGARCIEIGADWDGAVLRIAVVDDGHWREGGPGRGLASMRTRATSIGGQFDIEHAEDGTRVVLRLPLAVQPAART